MEQLSSLSKNLARSKKSLYLSKAKFQSFYFIFFYTHPEKNLLDFLHSSRKRCKNFEKSFLLFYMHSEKKFFRYFISTLSPEHALEARLILCASKSILIFIQSKKYLYSSRKNRVYLYGKKKSDC